MSTRPRQPGPATPAPGKLALPELLDLDPGLKAGRVELVHLGREEDVDAGLLGDSGVALLVARVRGEVFVRPELRRIDEEAGDEKVVLGPGRTEEREMAIVEGAHGGDQADGSVARLRAQVRDRPYELHDRVASARTS